MFTQWRPTSIWSLIFLNIYLPQFLYSKLNFIQTELSILITLWVGYLCNWCFSQNFANGLRLVSHKGSYFSGALFIGCFLSLPPLTPLTPLLAFPSAAVVDWLIVLRVPIFYPFLYLTLYHITLPCLLLKRQNIFLHLLNLGWTYVAATEGAY